MLPFVIGLPITNQSLPFLYACLGVWTLFWSFFLESKRMPGVIISLLKTFLTILTSFALQTMASNFALLANLAWLNTISFTFFPNPISFNALSSSEVRTVTPTNFVFPETFLAAFRASNPEFIWIVK